MTDKAYIVADEEQENEVLAVLCANGMKCFYGTSSQFRPLTGFPYVIYESNNSNVLKSGRVPKIKYSTYIVYDGRKESKMKIDEKVYKALDNWKENGDFANYSVIGSDILNLPVAVDEWWKHNSELSVNEKKDRLLAIIQFAMGKQPFEVEKPKKWIVRSKDTDSDGDYGYVVLELGIQVNTYYIKDATKFDTKEEAESWANSHQEVIEVEE